MIVFLDIPLELPAIDPLPVSVLFSLFYQIAPSAGLMREHPSAGSGSRVWKALTGWWALWLVVLAGGGLYYLVQDFLPRTVGNGIDSFGVRADLWLPYPSGGLIHLHGAMVMLLCSGLGVFILHRRTAVPAPAVAVPLPVVTGSVSTAAVPASAAPAEQPLSASVVSSAGALISPPATITGARQPEPTTPTTRSYVQRPANTAILTPEPPPTCRLTTPPPIAVVMPRRAPDIGKTHPCYVVGGIEAMPAEPSRSFVG
jgi:hypothetical protein